MQFATGVLARRGDLAGIAQLLHELCFDPIELDQPRLTYESRSSAQCRECAALWIASKAGKVMRIDLAVAVDGERPSQRWIPDKAAGPFDGAVRTMCHVHRGAGLGDGSFVLLGRENGFLDIIVDPGLVSRFDLYTWHKDGGGPRGVREGVPRRGDLPRDVEYTVGITAIAVITPGEDPETQHILVATRYPRLHVVQARGSELSLVAEIAMPGWIDWILCGDAKRPDQPLAPSERITCISRGGDIVRLTYRDLLAGKPGQRTQLSLLPTAAMPFAGDLLLGTATGLFLVRNTQDGRHDHDIAIALPVTHAPVLCLDRAALDCHCDDRVHDYITMGLEDGRLRVIDTQLIRRLAEGDQLPTPRLHNFAIEMPSAVLAVETLRLDTRRPDGTPANAAYVMAVLRDHSVRLFQVTTQHIQHRCFEQLWEQHVAALAATGGASGDEARFANELAAASAPAPAGCSDHAWTFARIDVVLPRLRKLADDERKLNAVIELACKLALGADRPALYQLSAAICPHQRPGQETLDDLCNGDVGRLLRLSRAMLGAVPRRQSREQRLFIDRHLRDLNIVNVRPDQRPRLIAWTRFVRKYVLLGHTFETKRLRLRELVDQSHGAAKFLDGLIYQVRLAQQHYDVLWDARVDGEVAQVHTVTCDALGTVVVAVTIDGRLTVFDHAGVPLWFDPDNAAVPPFTREQAARTLASAVAVDGAGFRVVLSCTLMPEPEATHAAESRRTPDAARPAERQPRLVVIDVGRSTDPSRGGRLTARIATVDTDEPSDPKASAAARHLPRPEVHAIRPLPGSATHFVVGLATDARPLGRLRWSDKAKRWELASFLDPDVPELAARSAPTRALAVERDDACAGYLIAAGADDGLVRVISVRDADLDAAWQVTRWDRVNDPITAVVLGAHPRHRPSAGADTAAPVADSNLFSCYVGTASGDTFALAIGPPSSSEPIAVSRFGPYEAEPLWRDNFDGPVLAIQRWRTPLFPSDPARATPDKPPEPAEILVIATEKGRLGLYNHDPAADLKRRRVSVQSNYFFRGMRLDRVAVADQLRAVAVVDDGAEVVIAGPHGQLSLVALAYLLNTTELDVARTELDVAKPGTSRKSRANPAGKLPATMPSRADHLFLRSVHDVPFLERAPDDDAAAVEPVPDDDDDAAGVEPTPDDDPAGAEPADDDDDDDDPSVALKLELCNLVRIESGALSHYILDWAWSTRDRWDQYDEAELKRRVHEALDPLDPENPEQALRFKLVLKAVCGAHLRQDPNAYREALETAPDRTLKRHEEVTVVCELVADYITRKLAYATRAAARLRIAAIKELMRVAMLRHIAGEAQMLPQSEGDVQPRIRKAIESALDACLRDDDRLVRIETLRAMWVMLRNVSVMADHAEDRAAFITALFPDELGSLDWLLQRLIGGLLRAPSFTRRSALIGIAWFHISVLLPVFRIFPRHTLALCSQLIDSGLGIEAVAMCARSLRSHRSVELRRYIQRLYLLEALDKTFSRDQYIELYKLAGEPDETPTGKPDVPATPTDAANTRQRKWFWLDNAELEGELTQLLDRMARLWEASDDMRTPRTVPLADNSPYLAIKQAVDKLSQIAGRVQEIASDSRAADGASDATLYAAQRDQLEALYKRYQSSVPGAPSLTEPIRTVLQEIIEVWQGICNPRALERGVKIGDYELGEAVVAGRSVFKLQKPDDLRDSHVIRVFRTWITGDAGERFLAAAKFTQGLRCEAAAEDARHLIEIREIVRERPNPAYVMRLHGKSLEARVHEARSRVECLAWAEPAARQLGRALRLIHRRGYHGDIKLSNIFLDQDGADRDPVFCLGGLAHAASAPGSLPLGGMPWFLRQKCQSADELTKRQWGDIVALSWVLYQVLDGAIKKTIPDNPAEILERLKEWRSGEQRVALPHLIDALERVFSPGKPSIELDELLAELQPDRRRRAALHRLRILHISDLHHRGRSEQNLAHRNLVLDRPWQANLAELRAGTPFDLVVFTGDVAFAGKPDQYELAESSTTGSSETWFARWLASTLEAAGCTREQLYIVPGNHDIDRMLHEKPWQALRAFWSKATPGDRGALASWFVRNSDAPTGVMPEWRDQVLERQSAFRNWLRALGRPELVPCPERSQLGYRHRLQKRLPFDVHVIGLDSAWLAGDDNDADKLRLTDEQIMQLCTDERSEHLTGLRIALVHHPLAKLDDGWDARKLLRGYGVGLLLYGHDHDARVNLTPEHGFLESSTGCLYEHHHFPNACTAITLGLDDNGAIQELELHFRTWGRSILRWHDDDGKHEDARAGRFHWHRQR